MADIKKLLDPVFGEKKNPKMMKGILIDSINKTVTEVELDGELQSMYNLIGCQRIEPTMFDDEHEIYVDEEGLFNNENQFFFMKDMATPMAGNGLILGFDPDIGDNWSHKLDLESIRSKVIFMTRHDAAMWSRLNQR